MAMAEKELERIYVIPLRGAKHGPSSKAAPRAIKTIRKFLSRHMKVDTEKIWIDESVNHAIWSRGKYKIPSKIRVRAVRFDDGVVEVSLPEVEFKSFREELKVIKESKKPILKKKEEEAEEEKKEGEEKPADTEGETEEKTEEDKEKRIAKIEEVKEEGKEAKESEKPEEKGKEVDTEKKGDEAKREEPPEERKESDDKEKIKEKPEEQKEK